MQSKRCPECNGLGGHIAGCSQPQQSLSDSPTQPLFTEPQTIDVMPIPYDPEIIQKHANKLYSHALLNIFLMTLIGGAIGAAAGYHLFSERHRTDFAFYGALFFGMVGFEAGQMYAFKQRLRAQMALCLKKIEENTRR